MRVLFADSVGKSTITDLEERGHTCVVEPGLQAGDLADRVAGFDVLVVRSTKVGAEVFEGADRLALVIRAGAGTNTIDTATAAARGVLTPDELLDPIGEALDAHVLVEDEERLGHHAFAHALVPMTR